MADESGFEMVPVSSSQIEAVGFNAATNQLRIRFLKNGSLYEYDNVDQATFDGLVNAPSVGSYFGAVIKGVNPYRRIA